MSQLIQNLEYCIGCVALAGSLHERGLGYQCPICIAKLCKLVTCDDLCSINLTHCCLSTPYGDIELANNGLGNGFMPSHYLSQYWLWYQVVWHAHESNFSELFNNTICNMNKKNPLLTTLPHLNGANELSMFGVQYRVLDVIHCQVKRSYILCDQNTTFHLHVNT